MSAIYKCDACGRTFDSKKKLTEYTIDAFMRKGGFATSTAWKGDLCGECLRSVFYEVSAAASKEITRISHENWGRA